MTPLEIIAQTEIEVICACMIDYDVMHCSGFWNAAYGCTCVSWSATEWYMPIVATYPDHDLFSTLEIDCWKMILRDQLRWQLRETHVHA